MCSLGRSNLIVIEDSETLITAASECDIRTMAVLQAHCITEYVKNHWQSHGLIHSGDYYQYCDLSGPALI